MLYHFSCENITNKDFTVCYGYAAGVCGSLCIASTAKLTNSYELTRFPYLKPAISRDELDVRIRNKFRDTLDTPIV